MDLRKAAEMALVCLDNAIAYSNEEMAKIDETKHELRQALAQPKREWVGLTGEEIAKADCIAMDYVTPGDYGLVEETVVEFARAIEAKLKEKNHGQD